MQLTFRQHLAVPRDELFAFHRRPANLRLLLAGWPGFELTAHEDEIALAMRLSVSQRVAFMRHDMVLEHVVFEPPFRFAERQIEGPFAHFEHLHEFVEADGGTIVVDRIEFALPWIRGGALADRLVVAPSFRRFFAFRRKAYARLIAEGRLR
jgi:ligand-binding SRPBCC domain-containing protein